MLCTDLQKIISNEGGLLSINTFFSTSAKRNVGLFYAQASIGALDTEAVLFEIDVKQADAVAATYADIDDLSAFRGAENEYLFSMGTVFRIGSAKKLSTSVWYIKLNLTRANDVQLEQLAIYIRRHFLVNVAAWEKFGKLMYEMGQYEKAEYFFGMSPSTSKDRAFTLNNLGLIHAQRHRLDDALECFQESLRIKLRYTPSTHTSLAETHLNIGLVYGEKGNVERAVEYCQRALNMLLADKDDIVLEIKQERIAECYTNLGEYLRRQGKMDEALSYHKHALQIQQQYLPSNHHRISMSYTNIALLLLQQQQTEEALKFCTMSLAIVMDSLPAKHINIGVNQLNLAFCLRQVGQLDEALQHALEAMKIFYDELGSEHSRTKQTQNFISMVQGEIAVKEMIRAFSGLI